MHFEGSWVYDKAREAAIPTLPFPPPQLGLIGHRGAAALCPENTLISMQTAHQQLNWIECDVQLTSDNHLVIIHDESLDRTSNGGSQLIWQSPLAHLDQYDYGAWFHSKFSNTPLLTLEILWRYANDTGLNLNLEIKPYGNASLLAQHFAHFLSTHSRQFDLLISSFNHLILHHLRQSNPELTIGFLVEEHDPILFQSLLSSSNCAYHLSAQSNSLMLLESLSQQDIALLAYTVNDQQLAHTLLQTGFWGVFTDNPYLLSTNKTEIK